MKTKIFLTGGTGYVGSALLKELLDRGETVQALGRNVDRRNLPRHDNLHWMEGDVLDTYSLVKAMEGCDRAYHTAAYARVWSRQPDEYFKHNVIGTKNVLDAAFRMHMKRVVLTSSAGVIGPCGSVVADENQMRMHPYLNEYEETKAMAEFHAMTYLDKALDVVIVNPSRIYGPGKESRSNPVRMLIKSMLKRNLFLAPSDGRALGSYSFIDDVVNGHLLAMEKGRKGERYILGGENISFDDLILAITRLSERPVRIVRIPMACIRAYSFWELLRANLTRYEPWIVPQWLDKYKYDAAFSSRKAMAELGYRITPVIEGLKKTIQSVQQT